MEALQTTWCWDFEGKRHTILVRCSCNGTVWNWPDKLDLLSAREREASLERFCQHIKDQVGPVTEEAKKTWAEEYLKMAAQAAEQKPAGRQSTASPGWEPGAEALEEIDVQQTIRPELFIAPQVSGVAVPVVVRSGERIEKRWRAYLRWKDGRREWREMFSTLDLPDGTRLWVHPLPGEPPAEMLAGWSREARQRWLSGEPAPDPAEVFKALCKFIAYYLDFRKEEAPGHTATIALFALLSYSSPAWPAVPYLFFMGTGGSGKSRALEVLQELVFRPYYSADPSPALVYRQLHCFGGIFLYDEAERLKNNRDPAAQELLALLQAGYRRGATASRLEPVGDRFQPVSFQVFGPKALASISGPPPVLASRCIHIPMIRTGKDSPKPKRRILSALAQPIRDMLHNLALEYGEIFLELPDRDVCPPEIFGRNYEVWQPVLSLASWIEEHGAKGLLKLLQEHALRSVEGAKEETIPAHDEILLQALAERLRQCQHPAPNDLLEAARQQEPELFRGWSAKGVAEHLRRYGLRTRKIHGSKVYTPDLRGELVRIEQTYGIDLGVGSGGDTTPGERTPTYPNVPPSTPETTLLGAMD